MPRIFVFGAQPTPEQYQQQGLFVVRDPPLLGRGELSNAAMFPDFASMWNAPQHQFEYDPTSSGLPYYDEAVLQPVFAWLENHAADQKWNWLEHCVNNWRSLCVNVWLDHADQAQLFEQQWGDRFKLLPHAVTHNLKIRNSLENAVNDLG